MKSGDLTRRILILSPVIVKLASGGVVTDWELVLAVWGKVEPLVGREFYSAKQVDSDVTHNITMRFNKSGLLSTYRLVHRQQIFEISSVIDVLENNKEIVVKATERTGVLKEVVVVFEDLNDYPASWDSDNSPVFLELS